MTSKLEERSVPKCNLGPFGHFWNRPRAALKLLTLFYIASPKKKFGQRLLFDIHLLSLTDKQMTDLNKIRVKRFFQEILHFVPLSQRPFYLNTNRIPTQSKHFFKAIVKHLS